MIGARKDNPPDVHLNRRLENIDQRVNVGSDELIPNLVSGGVGSQMNDGVHAPKMIDPMEIPAREIGPKDTRVAVRADIQQSQRVTAIQMLSELRAQVSRGAGNENRFWLGHD
jgi:hypothetical protein